MPSPLYSPVSYHCNAMQWLSELASINWSLPTTPVENKHMLNNFCFHVWAEKSLFIVENVNDFFWTAPSPYPLTLEFIELVPS